MGNTPQCLCHVLNCLAVDGKDWHRALGGIWLRESLNLGRVFHVKVYAVCGLGFRLRLIQITFEVVVSTLVAI